MHYEPSLYPHLSASKQFCVMVYDIWHGALQTLLCSQLYSSDQERQEHRAVYPLSKHMSLFRLTSCMQGYKIQSYRHQPSVKEEEKFKVIEALTGKLRAIFQSASTSLALFTTLVTFIRQMEVESSSNTSTHSTDDQVQRQQFLCLKALHYAFFVFLFFCSFFTGNVFCYNHNDWCISKMLYVEYCTVESKTTGSTKHQIAGMKIYFLTLADFHCIMLRYNTIHFQLSNYQYCYFTPVATNYNLNNLCINILNIGELPFVKTGLNDSKVSFGCSASSKNPKTCKMA